MELYDGSILRVIEYMENRIDCDLTLDELASEAAFSKFHFTRVFKAVTKETIYEYIRKRRNGTVPGKILNNISLL
ncbi:AraC family transcriptional regulator [Brevibacillus sp. NRS-1366]|uniref:AraC family transcriptional regulator n=1 Tax=Brevibacillus sp. NRS-1366 TaxID=3233899 RepID=UPI003D1E24CA